MRALCIFVNAAVISGMATPAANDLDALVARVDPDRWLASRFIADSTARAEVIVLYAFDYELARATKAVTKALMGEIRLTWWREVLDEIFDSRPVRMHPTARALAEVVARNGLPRSPLEGLIDARYDELGGRIPQGQDAIDWADAVGGGMMQLVALVLDPVTPLSATATAGRLSGLARLGVPPTGRRQVRKDARRLSLKVFPAVLPVALAGYSADPQLLKRLRLTWSFATGRL